MLGMAGMGGVLDLEKQRPVGLGKFAGFLNHRGRHYKIIYTESGRVRTGG